MYNDRGAAKREYELWNPMTLCEYIFAPEAARGISALRRASAWATKQSSWKLATNTLKREGTPKRLRMYAKAS